MKIQGIQKLTLLDFPGRVACTVFTVGCNLRCPFCHNSPLITAADGEMTAEEVLAFLKKRTGILDGVCITGGEPLLQSDIGGFMRDIRSLGYAVKLDTNGTLSDRLERLLSDGLVDYVAMDVKSSLESYDKLCGVNVKTENILRSIGLIKKSGVAHEFRTTAVRTLHDPHDFVSIAELIGDDRYFIQCFTDSGNVLTEGCEPFSKSELEDILREVRRYSPKAELRGV